jgi:type IV pilus assembly protein PilQ
MHKGLKRVGWLGLLALILPLWSATPVFAQGEPTDANMAQMDIGDGRVTFDVRGRTLGEVVDRIQDKTRVNIILTKEATEAPITIRIQGLHWLTALELCAEKSECILDRVNPRLIKVSRPQRVTFSIENEDITKVIRLLAEWGGANIVVAPQVKGAVTVNLKNIPWRDALEQIVKTLGYAVVEEDRGILRIVPRSQLKEQLETRVVRLSYIRPPSPYRAYLESEYAKEKIDGYDSLRPEKDFPILDALKAAVENDGGTIQYDRVTNSIVARGTKPALDNLEKLIQQIDTEPAQIFFDVKLVTTQNTELLDIGVDPGADGWTVATQLSATPSRLPFGVWREFDRVSPVDPIVNGVPPTTTFGTMDFTGVSMALRLFKEDRSSTILQAPKLVALDNTEATIFVGETVRYAQTSSASNQSGGLQFSIAEASQSPVQQGFQLLVIPHVIPNSDKVMVTVIPEAEQLSGTSTTLAGFDEFKSGQGANEVSILLPRVAASTIVTHMIVRSGETAVLGGLMQRTDVEVERGIPFVKDVPILGWLFKVKEKQDDVTHLIVFMTTRIIQDSDDIAREVADAMRRYRADMKTEWDEIWPEDVLPKVEEPEEEEEGCGEEESA